jgi:hypothetical protein
MRNARPVFVDRASVARAPARLAEKTPGNLPLVPQLRHAFPNGKLLVIVRHPVDALASYWRRHAAVPDEAWAGTTVDEFCTAWADSAAMATDFARRWPDAFLVLRYEDFTSDPASEFARVCSFIDEPMAVAALGGRRDRFSEVEPLLFDDIRPGGTGAAGLVPADVAAEVQQRLAPSMAALGYEVRGVS